MFQVFVDNSISLNKSQKCDDGPPGLVFALAYLPALVPCEEPERQGNAGPSDTFVSEFSRV